jgi:hypothetical protein
LAATARAQNLLGSYDGNWWVTQATEAQIAYIAGDDDCYVEELNGRAYPNTGLSEESARRVTRYIQKHPSGRSLPLVILLRHAFAVEKHVPVNAKTVGSAEYWPEKHGFFNGDYWYQLQGPGERASYVAAYLACEATFQHKAINHPVDYYVRAVNLWYGTHDGDGNLNPTRENEKIANVIQRALRKPR